MCEEDAKDIERMLHIAELKDKAKELSGDQMIEGESEDCPPEIAEKFWEHVVAFESAPTTTHRELLLRDGFICTPPNEMNDEELSAKLSELIEVFARRRVFLHSTNHLSDRQLYESLYSDAFDEFTYDFPPEAETNTHIDFVSSGSEEEINNWLKYYADEDERKEWAKDFPEDEIPAHEDPKYNRDEFLPRAYENW